MFAPSSKQKAALLYLTDSKTEFVGYGGAAWRWKELPRLLLAHATRLLRTENKIFHRPGFSERHPGISIAVMEKAGEYIELPSMGIFR